MIYSSYFRSLSLNFLSCKMGVMLLSFLWVLKISWMWMDWSNLHHSFSESPGGGTSGTHRSSGSLRGDLTYRPQITWLSLGFWMPLPQWNQREFFMSTLTGRWEEPGWGVGPIHPRAKEDTHPKACPPQEYTGLEGAQHTPPRWPPWRWDLRRK